MGIEDRQTIMAAVSIADQLKVLIELQKLDAQLYALRHSLDLKPAEAQQLKADQQRVLQELQTVEAQVKTLEVKRNSMETDLSQKEAQVKKLQTQLFQVKTNKEYSALQKEITGLKADQSVLEEEVLKLMEQIDQVKAHMQEGRQALKANEERLKAQLNRIEEEKGKIQADLRSLEEARGALTPKVEPAILSQYERILKRKEGLALAPVKGNACGGCYMGLPPQMINEIQMATRLIPCESCARILYLEPTA